VSGVQIIGEENGDLLVRSNFLIVRTMELDGTMMIFSTGQCQDVIAITSETSEGVRFKSRKYLFDSRAVETLLVIPL
jgi:anthranilate 1,2-dioxygenase small subunit